MVILRYERNEFWLVLQVPLDYFKHSSALCYVLKSMMLLGLSHYVFTTWILLQYVVWLSFGFYRFLSLSEDNKKLKFGAIAFMSHLINSCINPIRLNIFCIINSVFLKTIGVYNNEGDQKTRILKMLIEFAICTSCRRYTAGILPTKR